MQGFNQTEVKPKRGTPNMTVYKLPFSQGHTMEEEQTNPSENK